MKMKIREMAHHDVDKVLELGQAMHEESYFSFLTFNREKLLKLWASIMDYPQMYCGLVAETDDEIIGLFVGGVSPHWFSDELFASDMALYVTPSHRGSSAGVRLLKAYDKWATESGAKVINLGISTNVNQDRTQKLYHKLGYKDTGLFNRRKL
jgi:GNAT superfamily N-acetyltransferase